MFSLLVNSPREESKRPLNRLQIDSYSQRNDAK